MTRMTRRIALAVLIAAAAVASGCTTDVKGESCGFLDALVDKDGDTYCPDENAEADCEALSEALVDSQVDCGLPEEDVQQAIDDAFDCDFAVATSNTFDGCSEAVDEGFCLVDGLPDDCKGAILLKK